MKIIIKDKNKSKIKTKSKVLVLGLILIVLVGLFSPMVNVSAQTPPTGTPPAPTAPVAPGVDCSQLTPGSRGWDAAGCTAEQAAAQRKANQSEFDKYLEERSCSLVKFDMGGCLISLSYFIFLTIPSWLLILSAMLFNALIVISLNSTTIAQSAFISPAWGVVRDLSNLFFILILLYIAIKVILDLGGHDAKKMIIQVVIMALLINFSMFFTEVVIDSSNILALVFYNKLDIRTSVNQKEIPYVPVTNLSGEKDISGALASAFNPTKLLSQEFFQQVKANITIVPPGIGEMIAVNTPFIGPLLRVVGYGIPTSTVPLPLVLGIMVVSGLIMFFATYAFFVAGFAFLGRFIELWMLIIFSPFAFMSFTVPKLKSVEYIGWDAWIKNLLSISFMAPIFMFFMYFIFLLLRANIFGNLGRGTPALTDSSSALATTALAASLPAANPPTAIETILFVVIPALVILMLLHHATKYAKKASGAVGEFFAKTAQVVGALALASAGGAAIGGVAAGLQGSLGHAGKRIYESTTLHDMETSEKTGLRGWGERRFGSALRTLGGGDTGKGGLAGSSFDARTGVIGGVTGLISKATGVNLQGSKMMRREAGGYEADLTRRDQKRKKRAEGLKIKEGEPEKQKLNQYEEEHQKVSIENAEDIRLKDLAIASAKSKRDSYKVFADSLPDDQYKEGQEELNRLSAQVRKLESERSDIKNGGEKRDKDGNFTGEYRTDNGLMSEKMLDDNVNAADNEAKMAATKAAQAGLASEKAIDEVEKVKATAQEARDAAIAKAEADKDTAIAGVEAARVAAEASKAAVAKAKEELSSLDIQYPEGIVSLAPDVIAKREVSRGIVNKATEESKNAEAAMTRAATFRDAAIASVGSITTASQAAMDTAIATAEAAMDTAEAERVAAESAVATASAKARRIKNSVEDLKEEDKRDREQGGKGKIGRSQNDYEDHLVPHQKHVVEEVSKGRARSLANNIENQWSFPWNKAARKKSAHEIRMGAKPEKSHGGGGHGGGSHFLSEVAAGVIAERIGEPKHAPAKDSGAHPPAASH